MGKQFTKDNDNEDDL
jgi:septal ring factor EnvC (AmiA/AmiB activator)